MYACVHVSNAFPRHDRVYVCIHACTCLMCVYIYVIYVCMHVSNTSAMIMCLMDICMYVLYVCSDHLAMPWMMACLHAFAGMMLCMYECMHVSMHLEA